MRGIRNASATAAGLLCLAACGTLHARREVAAVIVDPTDESRAALAQTIGAALHGTPVTLADDALTRACTLVVEPVRPRDANGLPLQGRELRAPERFRLVKNGAACVLVHERTGKRSRLAATACAPP